jgi:hypothetical protein
MSVPTTGGLSLRNIARERLYGNYGGGGTITGAVSMFDLLNGGNAGGSGNTYPALNQACFNVAPNGSMNSWRGYCQNWLCYYPGSGQYSGVVPTRNFNSCVPNPGGTTISYWASDQLTNASTGAGWTVNSTIIYSANGQPCNGGTSTVLANTRLVIYYAGGATPNCYIDTNGSGVVTSITTC